jgi:hypothetical protein
VGITLVGVALGVVLGLAVAQISGEYCIHIRDWDLCDLDNARAMISGGLIGGAAGLLWSWRQ